MFHAWLSVPRSTCIFIDWTVQSAQKIHLYGPPELKNRIVRWNARGQHGVAAAAHATSAILQHKWRTVSGGLDLILEDSHPLGFWPTGRREAVAE